MNPPWYIVQTKPTCEDQVKSRWELAGYEVFLPKIKKMVRGVKNATERVRPLFPSYLFARLCLDDAQVFHNVRYTRGVHRILGTGHHPVPVSDAIVETIVERVGKDGFLEQHLTYKEGDIVRIKSGPLSELIGVLEKPVSPSGMVRVLLEVYSKTVRAELSCAEVDKIS